MAHTARNAQGVDAVVEEVEGGAKRKMTEEILCHDHEKSRIRNNLMGGGCGGARGEEKKKQGQETMIQTGGVLLRREAMVEMRLS